MQIILASSSPHRLRLLKSINIVPDQVISPNIDETALHREKPDHLVTRLAEEKAIEVSKAIQDEAYIIAADTIVGTKNKIFDKAYNNQDVLKYLNIISGRKIYIKTAVTVLQVSKSVIIKKATRLITSKVSFKRFKESEINHYIKSGIGLEVAGGVNIEGFGEILIKNISGSYSGIIGLPLYETLNLLQGMGYDYFKS